MTRNALVVDAAIAVFVGAVSLAIVAGGGFGDSATPVRTLDAPGVALIAASSAPLVLRQRSPLTAYLLSSAATLVLFGLSYPLDIPLAPAVAVSMIGAAYGGARRPARALALAVVAALVPATVVAYTLAGAADPLQILVPEMLVWALFLAVVWIAGDRTRLRRERLAALEERAVRAEQEAERERRVAAAQERLRIARELHDSAGHAINTILVQAGAARLLQERDPDGSRRALGTIEQVARHTIGEIDRLVRALRDGDRDDADAAPADPTAIGELVAYHRGGGLPVTARVDSPPPDVPRGVTMAAYRILQEALTNAARHGRGGAEVTVRYADTAVEITVRNPIDSGRPAGGGHGVTGMRERATLLGGTLEATRTDGTFQVHARLPYAEVAAA